MDVHVSLQVDSINKLLGTQITCNHRLSGMQQSVCLQVISTCEGWTAIITNELLLISVPCHVSFEVCTFNKCSVTLCALVSFVSWWKETTYHNLRNCCYQHWVRSWNLSKQTWREWKIGIWKVSQVSDSHQYDTWCATWYNPWFWTPFHRTRTCTVWLLRE